MEQIASITSISTLKIEARCSFETLGDFQRTIGRYVPEEVSFKIRAKLTRPILFNDAVSSSNYRPTASNGKNTTHSSWIKRIESGIRDVTLLCINHSVLHANLSVLANPYVCNVLSLLVLSRTMSTDDIRRSLQKSERNLWGICFYLHVYILPQSTHNVLLR
jgi:hypothetical protein